MKAKVINIVKEYSMVCLIPTILIDTEEKEIGFCWINKMLIVEFKKEEN